MGQGAILVKHFIVMQDIGRELHINARTVTAYPTVQDAVSEKRRHYFEC